MKSKSSEFMSQCRVLNFPWADKRERGAKRINKSERRISQEQAEYSGVLTFQPPPVEFTSEPSDLTFPLIQMMNGKEPVVWEDKLKTQKSMKEMVDAKMSNKLEATRSLSCSSQVSSVGKSKSKSRIPRPKNAFILYRSHVGQLLKETMSFKVRESNISSLVSEMWKKESDTVRAYYSKRAALEWVKYMKRLQQDCCDQNSEDSSIKSLASPVLSQNVLSLSSESLPNTVSYTQPVFSNPAPGSVSGSTDENSIIPSCMDLILDSALYNSMDTSLGSINTDTTLLSSPQSSNEDIFDPSHPTTGQLEVPEYSFIQKTSSSLIYPFKDSSFPMPYDMNQLDMGYSYPIINPPAYVFPTNTCSYVVDTGLGLDTNIHWSGIMPTPAVWPLNMI